MDVKIESSWQTALKNEFDLAYFLQLTMFVQHEYLNKKCYPPANQIFSAFDFTPYHDVRVVIVGQDPYHGEGQANGMCFSVSDGIKPPPSLKNMYKELKADIGVPIPTSGNLEQWAKQGVLLLNTTLTVRAGMPGSHQKKGWEKFTDKVIQTLNDEKQNIVFILWGASAQKKIALLNADKHFVIGSAHPSPFSANKGFFGSKPFSSTNAFLKANGIKEIVW